MSSDYLAIARQWRPARFEDLVGQGPVVQTLQNAIRLGRVSHSYLFSGARGVGKTSVARLFAKALRCSERVDAEPCSKCSECVAIAEGRAVDVVEIDGASNNGVEAVRGIRENVAYAPGTGDYKIYIIDEVHMLSLSAFNALLKTLEEPPKHVIFLFATTEPQKIPVTILSRCQRFEFRRLSQTEIVDRLRRILDAEKLSIDDAGLRAIAAHSDGALRDALSLLDQVLAYCGKNAKIGETEVAAALGLSRKNAITAFLRAILAADLKAILASVEEVYSTGSDLGRFAERCLEELRVLYLLRLARESGGEAWDAERLDLSATHFAELDLLASGATLIQLERMAQIFSKAISQLGSSSLPRFVLEMAAIRMSKLDALSKLEEKLASAPVAVAVTAAPPAPTPAAPAPRVAAEKPVSAPPPAPPPVAEPATGGDWKQFVDNVMKKRPLLGSLLHHAEFKFEGNQVRLSFAEDSFYERQAQDPKNRKDIDDLAKAFFGKDTQLVLSSGEAGKIESIEARQQSETAAIKKNALEDPTVIKLKEMLGAEVVDVNIRE